MLETQGQMKTPPDERDQEKENNKMQDLLLLLKDKVLEFGNLKSTCDALINQCKNWVEKPKAVEQKKPIAISPEIQLLIAQGRMSELTVEQLAELEKYREPIK